MKQSVNLVIEKERKRNIKSLTLLGQKLKGYGKVRGIVKVWTKTIETYKCSDCSKTILEHEVHTEENNPEKFMCFGCMWASVEDKLYKEKTIRKGKYERL